MIETESDPQKPSRIQLVYRFIGGAALGAFVVIIYVSNESPIAWNVMQVSIACLLILSGAILSSIWGDKFIDTVTRALNAISL
jgi:hypothetical protein